MAGHTSVRLFCFHCKTWLSIYSHLSSGCFASTARFGCLFIPTCHQAVLLPLQDLAVYLFPLVTRLFCFHCKTWLFIYSHLSSGCFASTARLGCLFIPSCYQAVLLPLQDLAVYLFPLVIRLLWFQCKTWLFIPTCHQAVLVPVQDLPVYSHLSSGCFGSSARLGCLLPLVIRLFWFQCKTWLFTPTCHQAALVPVHDLAVYSHLSSGCFGSSARLGCLFPLVIRLFWFQCKTWLFIPTCHQAVLVAVHDLAVYLFRLVVRVFWFQCALAT